ncbi:GntR family transcriptional regulator [Rhodobacter sp. SGA-6-6]|uniref:GntR family transcriptional regulator n=1 Tax=Rhodobacter sp. SGA-6-6 TaxID=2710882 RepID=UPI0013E9B4C4|nr:GntR family transcriptional regulator [Rhodobacter sp. SGA-6-6]NGM44425.1 GntR family transcriptional regulator [Rhodobacter sp. SGA-6-6]
MEQLFSPEGFDDPGSGPLYLQLQRRIAEAIASGRLSPGDSLPAERDMAAMTGLSRVTVRNAIQALVAGGQLVQRRGSGTFVAQKVERLEQALSLLTSFTEDMARRGRTVDSHWLSRRIDAPAPEEVMALGLGGEERVARLERVRRSDGVPLAIERASIPASILPDPAAVEGSLYLALEKLGSRPVRAVQRISAANLGPRDADLLGVTPGVAGLKIERIGYLASGRVVEFTRSLYRGDAYDFAVELKLSPEGQAR